MASFHKTARQILHKTSNDVVVLSAVRSPITRAFKGGFRNAYPEDILGPVRYLRFLQTSSHLKQKSYVSGVGYERSSTASKYRAKPRPRRACRKCSR